MFPMSFATRMAEDLVEAEDRIQFLVDWIDKQGLLEEHCFTFPDGFTWYATEHWPETKESE